MMLDECKFRPILSSGSFTMANEWGWGGELYAVHCRE